MIENLPDVHAHCRPNVGLQLGELLVEAVIRFTGVLVVEYLVVEHGENDDVDGAVLAVLALGSLCDPQVLVIVVDFLLALYPYFCWSYLVLRRHLRIVLGYRIVLTLIKLLLRIVPNDSDGPSSLHLSEPLVISMVHAVLSVVTFGPLLLFTLRLRRCYRPLLL